MTLLRNLDRGRFRVALAVLNTRDAVFRDEVPIDVELIDLQVERVRYSLVKIVRLIWRRRPDVVFSTLGHLNLAIAAVRCILPNSVRYIAREATIVSQLPGSFAIPWWWFSLYRLYGRLDAIVCQSDAMREDLVRHLGVPLDKTVVIHNPVDLERIRQLAGGYAASTGKEPPPEELRLVAAGSLTHVKGFDILIEALSQCRGIRFHLTVLGEGPLRRQLEEAVTANGLSGSVAFAGFVKNPYTYFAAADALVLSSRFEGFPNVVLESLACGTPVIAIPSPGGIREILQHIPECVLAENCSPAALASALRNFRGGRVAPQALDRYAIRRIVGRYEQCFWDIPSHRVRELRV